MGTAADATLLVGALGRIEDVNDGACTLFGHSRSELLQMHGTDLILAEDRPRVAVSIDRMRQGVLEDRQGRILRKDRSVVEVDVHASPLADGRLMLTVRPRADEPR